MLLRKMYGNLKIRWKIFLSIVFVSIFACGGIGFFSYRNTSSIAVDRYIKVLAGTLAQVDINMNDRIKTVENISMAIAWNDDVRKALSKKEKNTPLSEQLKDMEKMQNLIISSTRNERIQIKIFTGNNAIYNNERVIFFSQDELAGKKWYKKLAGSKFTKIWDYANLNEGSAGENRKISCIMPVRGIDDFSENVGYIEAIIDENQLKNILDGLRFTADSSAFLIDSSKNIISYSSPSKESFPVSEKFMETAFSVEKHSIFNENGDRYVLISRPISCLNWRVIYLMPYKRITSSITDDLQFYIIIFVIIMIIALIMSVFISDSMTRRISGLAKSMRDFKGKGAEIMLSGRYNDEITELQLNFNDMVHRINDLIREVYQKEVEKKDAELKAFQAQINPHFLYNTLDMINWMALEKKEYQISGMIGRLSTFFRLSLRRGANITRIGDEFEHVKVYLEIQQKRFEGSLESEIEADTGIYQYMSVKLILQPLVENAILHGIQKTESQSGKIVIRGRKLNNEIILSVEDNGVGADLERINKILSDNNDKKQHSGYGIYNTDKRIKLLFGNDYGLKYSISSSGGSIAEIRFPAILYELGQNE